MPRPTCAWAALSSSTTCGRSHGDIREALQRYNGATVGIDYSDSVLKALSQNGLTELQQLSHCNFTSAACSLGWEVPG